MRLLRRCTKADITRSLVVCLCMVGLFFLKPFSYFDYILQDKLYQNPGLIDPRIIVIGVDQEAQSKLGSINQWSRQYMADAITILNSGEEKPAVIAVDILYTGNSNDPVADQNLANAARNGGNVVTVSLATFGWDLQFNNHITDVELPFPALAQATTYGLVNGTRDETDGTVRSAFMQTTFNGELLRSFTYEIYRKYTGNASIPALEGHGEVFITYSGLPGDYGRGISFSDIFEEDFDPSLFAGCIVLIGPYSSAMMDSYNTPVSSNVEMFGVEIHANTLQMLLEGNFKFRVSNTINFLLFSGILLIGIILMLFIDIRPLLLAYGLLGGAYVTLALYLFKRGHIIQLLPPLLTLVLLYIYQIITSYVTESIEKKKVKDTFKKYVDPKLAENLIEMGNTKDSEVGAQRDIAVLFVDLRGFTTMSETLKDRPALIVKILNEYLEHTSNCVFQNGGSIDKFIGDATMALFNGFAPLDDYVYRAVKTGLDIMHGAEKLNASLYEKYGIDVGFGIGIQCGKAIVGNLGPAFRKDYTAIGDTVNTAARLEGRADKSTILISKEVYTRLEGRIVTEYYGCVNLKGKALPVDVYSVTGLTEKVHKL